MTKEIELLKQEIKMLQSKLSFLDELEKTKSPVEEAYKDWWGQYPELETDSEYDDMRWRGFKAGFQAAYEEKVREDDDVVDEPYRNVSAYWDEKDNPASYITDEVVNRLVRQLNSKKLWHIMRDKLEFSMEVCDEIVDAVEEWLPKEHDTNSDGWNKCVRMLWEKLR